TGVQAALRLRAAAPAAGARVFAFGHGRRARPAADARVAARVQRVHRDVVRAQVVPHRGARPGRERVELDEAEAGVALDHARRGARRRLVAADRGDPGREARERLAQGEDLAQLAAAVRIALPEPVAVGRGLIGDRLLGPDGADDDAVTLLQ